MRNANRQSKSSGWALALICALMLLFVLFGCDSTGAGGSDDGGKSDSGENDSGDTGGSDSTGEALVLPEGTITGWNLGTRDDVVVILVDVNADPVQGYGPVTVEGDGEFPGMTIDPPPSQALLSWEDFRDAYEYELLSVPVSITDESVRFQSFCYLDVQYTGDLIVRGTDDQTVAIGWIYVDGPTHISINAFDTGDYEVTIDLELSTGWNGAVLQQDDINKVVTLETDTEPAGTAWILE
ncbi:MAG: hypothetical protein ACQETQ_11940 [Spirochaetota bacterium]